MKKKLKIILIISATILLISYNEAMSVGEKRDYKMEIKENVKQVDISDGVSKEEAIVIAQNYILKEGLDKAYITTQFSVKEWGLHDELWRIDFKATYAESIKQGSIFGLLGVFKWWISVSVDKKTGEVKDVGGPDL